MTDAIGLRVLADLGKLPPKPEAHPRPCRRFETGDGGECAACRQVCFGRRAFGAANIGERRVGLRLLDIACCEPCRGDVG